MVVAVSPGIVAAILPLSLSYYFIQVGWTGGLCLGGGYEGWVGDVWVGGCVGGWVSSVSPVTSAR